MFGCIEYCTHPSNKGSSKDFKVGKPHFPYILYIFLLIRREKSYYILVTLTDKSTNSSASSHTVVFGTFDKIKVSVLFFIIFRIFSYRPVMHRFRFGSIWKTETRLQWNQCILPVITAQRLERLMLVLNLLRINQLKCY